MSWSARLTRRCPSGAWRRSCHSREQTRPSRSRTVRPSPLLFLASKVFCSFIVCTPTCAKHSPLPPAWFLPQYEHHSRPGHRAGLVREVPPRIAAGQRRSEHCRWLAGTGQSGASPPRAAAADVPTAARALRCRPHLCAAAAAAAAAPLTNVYHLLTDTFSWWLSSGFVFFVND